MAHSIVGPLSQPPSPMKRCDGSLPCFLFSCHRGCRADQVNGSGDYALQCARFTAVNLRCQFHLGWEPGQHWPSTSLRWWRVYILLAHCSERAEKPIAAPEFPRPSAGIFRDGQQKRRTDRAEIPSHSGIWGLTNTEQSLHIDAKALFFDDNFFLTTAV